MSKQHKAKNGSKKTIINNTREIRVSRLPVNTKFEVRTDEKTGTRTVAGYFARFNVQSRDIGWRETLLPGCFKASLASSPMQCLFNHDSSKLLGRTESKTLEVWEDTLGLAFRVKLPNVSYANDLAVLLSRGDSFECSFGFYVPDGGDEWSQLPDGSLQRVINKAEVFEGSILVSPAAFPETSASLRSIPKALRGFLDGGKQIDNSDAADDDCDDADKDEDGNCPEQRCMCECSACEAGDCDQCTNDECDDDNCEDCPLGLRSLRERLYKLQRRVLGDKLEQLNQQAADKAASKAAAKVTPEF